MILGRRLRHVLGLLVAVGGVACVSADHRDPEAADDAFREKPPAPAAEVAYVPSPPEEARLANGLRILVARRPELPVVAMQLAIRRGVDQGSPAVAAILTGMRLRGTGALPSKDFLEAADATGGGVSMSAGYDALAVSGWGLSGAFPELLDLVGGAVRAPAFDPAEIELERASQIAGLTGDRGRPAELAEAAVRGLLYPAGHPYAGGLTGTSSELANVKKGDLEAMQDALIGPSDAVLAIAGDVTVEQARTEAQRVFGDWKGRQKPRTPVADPPPLASGGPRVVLVPRPGATQSYVLVAARGTPSRSADIDALLMVGSRVGGRIQNTLRELHHVTYDVAASTSARLGAGPFTISTAVETKYTLASIREIFAEIERTRAQRMNSVIMGRLRRSVLRPLPRRFETARATASALTGIAIYDLPLDWHGKRPQEVANVTSEDVQRVASTYLAPERRVLVVVGDPKLEPYLATLGMGRVVVREAKDVLP